MLLLRRQFADQPVGVLLPARVTLQVLEQAVLGTIRDPLLLVLDEEIPAAIAISEILRRIGFDADPPEDAGLDGWEFEVRVKGYPMGVRLYCKVTLIDYHYVMLYNMSWWDGVRKRHPAPYIEALRALGREMAADPRFFDVLWYERNYDLDDVVGAPQPVDDE